MRVRADNEAAAGARALHARAFTIGSDIVFGSGHYAPTTSQGRHLLAHELAHVVQQEKGTVPFIIQRFTEPGHKLLGDAAFGSELCTLGKVQMTFGEAVAMGDYFGSFDYMRMLAEKDGKGRDSKGVVLYVLWVKILKHKKESKLGDSYDEGAVFQADQISRSQDTKNISHFPNPLTGDTGLDPNQKNQRVGKDKKTLGAAATYRQAHEQAMRMAYVNGTVRQSNDDALLADAFACHFLTDSFSASHLRTPRASIKEYWDQKVPGFRKKLIEWLADKINAKPLSQVGPVNLAKRFFAITGFPFKKTPNATVRSAAVTQLSILLSGGEYSFGDVVSLIVHDAEGAAGVQATIDGKPITLVGDKDLVEETPKDPRDPEGEKNYSLKGAGAAYDTAQAAIAAVKASLEDIYDAYAAGLPEQMSLQTGLGLLNANFGLDLRKTYHHKDFETFRKEALGRRRLYRAEQLVPTAVDDKLLPPGKRNLPWMQKSVDDLLADSNQAIGKALSAFGKAEAQEFEDRLKDMQDLEPIHKQAIQEALIDPLKSGDAKRIRGMLKSILHLKGDPERLRVGPMGVERAQPETP